jgi:ribonuclease BN (tRNA processing enzyme)
VEDGLEIARMAKVKRLLLFHHAPEHSDALVDAKLSLARDLARSDSMEIYAASEGKRFSLDRSADEKGEGS